MRFLLLLVTKVLDKISYKIGSFSSHIYFTYCVESCPDCNGSGFELGFENTISDCKHCKGDGYNEVEW